MSQASKITKRASFVWLLGLVMAGAGCVPVARPVVKIGLVAPFEGRYRDVGYEVVFAVRLAVREANSAGGVAGYTVELTTLDDSGDADMAVEQARKLATDPALVGVIGDWLDATTQAASATYAAEGLPLLATTIGELPRGSFRLWPAAGVIEAAASDGALCPLPCDMLDDLGWLKQARDAQPAARVYGPPLWAQGQFAALAGPLAEGARFVAPAPYPADSADPSFAERYGAISGGVQPGPNAVLAYDAARMLFAAISESAGQVGRPSRQGVSGALATIHFNGLSGPISFDSGGNWAEARGWVYEWRGGKVQRP